MPELPCQQRHPRHPAAAAAGQRARAAHVEQPWDLDQELPGPGAQANDRHRRGYSAGDFALCYVCHGQAPFAPDGTSNATNFSLHGLHLTGLAKNGSGGTDIDTAGDGQGNAICAECHFRLHSTTNKVGTQVIRSPDPAW